MVGSRSDARINISKLDLPRGAQGNANENLKPSADLSNWAKGTMTARWIYTSKGEAPYYQEGDYIYSKEGACRFSVSAGWWRDINTGEARLCSLIVVYALNGEPAFYFG